MIANQAIREVIGLPEDQAIQLLENNQIKSRVTRRNNQSYVLTMDFNPERVNLIIKDGIVTGANLG